MVKLRNVIETDLLTVNIEGTLGDLIKVISKSKRNIFPVVDENHSFRGIILLDDIREIIFNKDLYDQILVKDLVTVPPSTISLNDRMDKVMKKFNESEAWNLPVLDEMKYIGFVSKSSIFNAYRSALVQFTND